MRLILLSVIMLCAGCVPLRLRTTGFMWVTEIEGAKPLDPKDCVVLVSEFERPPRTVVKNSEGRVKEIRGTPCEPPEKLVALLRESGVFKDVVTRGEEYDLVLTGQLSNWQRLREWWWVQLFDLWAHTLVLPTIPVMEGARCDLKLTHRNGAVVRDGVLLAWRTRLCSVWWYCYQSWDESVLRRGVAVEALREAVKSLAFSLTH
jgi:hypothetical protein